MRILSAILLAIVAVAGCHSGIYLRDGVTDGDTFYLAERALTDPDPALQSWASYSLTRSACQLEIGGPNPARASSFDCELTARRRLLETWREHNAEEPVTQDGYLDALASVQTAGFLEEYVDAYFRQRHWDLPDDLERREFREWRRRHLPGHKPRTRIIGSWNYAKKVL